MSLLELESKINSKGARLAVIGLGYVGLPVACEFARVGFNVLGIEKQKERVDLINSGICPIVGEEPGLQELLNFVLATDRFSVTCDYQNIKDCDVILIDVETPIDENCVPHYDSLRCVLDNLGPVLKHEALVIVESTISPGTMENLVLPLLTKVSGKKLNQGFYLGNCPERVMPGKLLENLRVINRVIGGMCPETARVMEVLYRNVVQGNLDLADCVTAELVKTTENAYRDVQIAFANEIALICEILGADVWKVRELVNKSPHRNMHLPGAGVGGHCIPKDPWLLADSVKNKGIPLRLIPISRQINDGMPLHILDILEKALDRNGLKLKDAYILVLGYSYLENSDDIRNSPSEKLVDSLRSRGARVVIHDPFVREYQCNLLEAAEGCDAVIVMVKHSEYIDIDLELLRYSLKTPILIDGRNVFAPEKVIRQAYQYWSVGRGVMSG